MSGGFFGHRRICIPMHEQICLHEAKHAKSDLILCYQWDELALIKMFPLKFKLLTRTERFVASLSQTSMAHVTVPPCCGGSVLGLGASGMARKK